MMHMIRKVVVFLLFSILIVAFAISMGGNNYFDRFTPQTVAKVGSIDVTPQQYRPRIPAHVRQFEREGGAADHRRAKPKRSACRSRCFRGSFRMPRSITRQRSWGSAFRKQGLRQNITGNEVFQDASGKFSPEKYQQFLAAHRL